MDLNSNTVIKIFVSFVPLVPKSLQDDNIERDMEHLDVVWAMSQVTMFRDPEMVFWEFDV